MHLSFDIGSGKFQGRDLPVEAYRARVVLLATRGVLRAVEYSISRT